MIISCASCVLVHLSRSDRVSKLFLVLFHCGLLDFTGIYWYWFFDMAGFFFLLIFSDAGD